MRGIHTVEISDKRVRYSLQLRRNITIITGDSATGKSTIVKMLTRYRISEGKGYIKVNADVPVYAFPIADAQTDLRLIASYRDSVIILDESAFYMTSKDFAEVVAASSCYFVLITRESLPMLPYSVEEIYDLQSSRTNSEDTRVFHTMNRLYHSLYNRCLAECVVTEDSNSGFDFFHALCNCRVDSAKSISKVAEKIRNSSEMTAVVIDGAGAGAFIRSIIRAAENCDHEICVWAEESFEYLILKSGIIHDRELLSILEAPEQFVESEKYISWERFFTHLLIERTKHTVLAYTKRRLPLRYLEPANADRIWKEIPEGLEIPRKLCAHEHKAANAPVEVGK